MVMWGSAGSVNANQLQLETPVKQVGKTSVRQVEETPVRQVGETPVK